jgi:hypothetical protein
MQVELDLRKYIFGCFLKCELKLEQMTMEQFRALSEFIPKALQSRHENNSGSFIPHA